MDQGNHLEEDLSQVDADPSELMACEKPEPNLRFGPTLVSNNLIKFYISKGHPPGNEDTPDPREGVTVVFCDIFTVGLHFPLDPPMLFNLVEPDCQTRVVVNIIYSLWFFLSSIAGK